MFGERYSSKSANGIICALKRFLVEKSALNLLVTIDKTYSKCLHRIIQRLKMHCFRNLVLFFLRKFDLFRRCLDAEMKNGVRERLQIMNDKEEKSLWARKKKQHSGRRNFWKLLQVVIKHNRFLQRKSLWAAWGRPQRYRGKQLWSWFELHYTSKKLVLMDYCIHVRLYELHGDTRTDDCIYASNCDFSVIHRAHWNNA